jgi:hypothetical protein
VFCIVGWSEDVKGFGNARIDRENISVALRQETRPDGSLRLAFTVPGREVPLHLERTAFELLFLDNPALFLKCRLAAEILATITAWDEGIARHLKSDLAIVGRTFDVDLKPLNMDFDIKRLEIKLPAGQQISMDPLWATKSIGFVQKTAPKPNPVTR